MSFSYLGAKISRKTSRSASPSEPISTSALGFVISFKRTNQATRETKPLVNRWLPRGEPTKPRGRRSREEVTFLFTWLSLNITSMKRWWDKPVLDMCCSMHVPLQQRLPFGFDTRWRWKNRSGSGVRFAAVKKQGLRRVRTVVAEWELRRYMCHTRSSFRAAFLFYEQELGEVAAELAKAGTQKSVRFSEVKSVVNSFQVSST